MITRLEHGALEPAIAAEEAERIAGLLRAVASIVLVAVLGHTLVSFLLPGGPILPNVRLIVSGIAVGLELGVLEATRRRHLGLAATLQTFGAWGVLTFALSVFGGASNPALGGYLVLIAVASLLLSSRSRVAFIGLSLLTVLAMAWAEGASGVEGYPLVPMSGPLGEGMSAGGVYQPWTQVLLLALMAAIMHRVAGMVAQALGRQYEGTERLRLAHADLERQVQERTQELETANARLTREVDERSRALASLRTTTDHLQKAQRRLDAILAYLPRLVLYETREGQGALVGNIEGLLGYPSEQFNASQGFFLELIHPEDIDDVRQAYARWDEGGREGVLSQEFRCRRADDEYIWLQDYAVSVTPQEGEPYMAGVLLDVSDRMLADEERRRFTRQLRTAAETAERLTAILDPELLMHETVDLMQDRFGLYHVHFYLFDRQKGELVVTAGSGDAGRKMVKAGHSIPTDAERSIVANAAKLQRYVLVEDVQDDPRFLPNPLLPDTRSEVAIPLLARDGLMGVLDVQDDKAGRFTASDLDTFSTLAGQIAVAIENARVFEEMQRVMDRLREVDRLKSEFLANMSHELRTPLNSIIGYAELILMGINGELDEETSKDVQAIFDNGQQLLTLINDVLDLAKIEAGRMHLELEAVPIGPLLEEVRTRNAGLLLKKPIHMNVEVEPGLPHLMADRLRLEQILNNLVSNAVKFTEEGHLWLRAFRDGEEICLQVEDTGVGIDEEGLATIFDKFRQADGSFTRRAKGTGLGLAITRHLVDMHEGRIHVRSIPGHGSTFTVCLPARPSAALTQEQTLSLEHRTG